MSCHIEIAERELAAFVAAVSELFGPEPSLEAAEDWIEKLALLEWPTENARPDFRQVTIAAASRLAQRICSLDLAIAACGERELANK